MLMIRHTAAIYFFDIYIYLTGIGFYRIAMPLATPFFSLIRSILKYTLSGIY
jgi:hypothetical protein